MVSSLELNLAVLYFGKPEVDRKNTVYLLKSINPGIKKAAH